MGLLGKSSGGPAVGIDIGNSLIKVAEVKPGKDGLQVTALGVSPTPPGAIDNEIIVDPQALGQAIRQLLSESGISCKRSVSSVSGQSSVIVRIIEVPRMTKQELAETMKWEVERHVPFAADEVVMDFEPIERPTASPDDENMEVLLAVAQQEVISNHVEALLAAGLEPIAIDVEQLAVCRSLIDTAGNGSREQTIAVINIGSSATELGIYQNGLLAFPRTLPIAGDAITRSLSDTLNISISQAERLKREKAAILLDRAVQISASMGMQPMIGLYDQPDATIGFAPETPEAADADFGFIPGLGFAQPAEEEETPVEGSGSVPDFDIDIGGASPEPPSPVMDFDMSLDEEEPAVLAPEPQLDLSAMADAGMPEADTLAPAVVDLSPESESSEVDLSAFSQEAIFDAMVPVLSDLIVEIRRSLEYYASRFQSQPDKILICGGTAKLKDLDEFIQSELGIPVEVANPLQNVTVFSRSLSQDYLGEVAAIFSVSVGLAIRDLIGE